jgi:sortase A
LLLAGIAAVAIWTWWTVRGAVFQRRENRIFDNQRSAPERPSPSPLALSPQAGALVGRLVIPKLHLRAIVREGTDGDTLDVALGHVSGTALPGQTGNVGIAGHRDTLFRCLRNISMNDRIVFQTAYGSYTYFVERTNIVKPQDVGVLAPGTHSEITLITCYPFRYVGPAPDRFVVTARLDSAR